MKHVLTSQAVAISGCTLIISSHDILDFFRCIKSVLQSIITICPISRSQQKLCTPAHASDEEHSSCWSCPATILICIQFTSVFFFFFHILKIATEVARQQSLINNALFLTFATMCHYQKGLDFPGVTFRSWVRCTVSTSRSANGDQYPFFLYGNVKKTEWASGGGNVK